MSTTMHRLLLFALASIVLIECVGASNILVITFLSTKSHKITYLPLIEELGKRGHNITMVSPVKPMKEMKNVKEIYTMDVESLFQNDNFNAFEMKEKGDTMDPGKTLGLVSKICEMSYDLPQVRSLLQEKFDLVFLQPLFNDCVLALIYRLQVPFVLFTPTYVPPFIATKVGAYFPPSITPNFMLGYPAEMTFYQRFVNLGVNAIMDIFIGIFYEPKIERIYREKLGEDIPGINEIVKNASLVLSNGHFSLTGPRPYMPDIVDVGGIHSRPAKPIPKDLEDFINKGKDGFIVFSMGSAIKGDMMPESKRKMILNVFSKLKQQIFWKWESETMDDLPKNVLLKKWLPLQDLLGHKDIKLFITHCGGGSTEESIYHGVPLVGVPMLADQPQNANLAKRHGFLVEVNWNEMTEESFSNAINEVLNNPIYRDNVKKLSALFKDRPVDPLENGVYWINYVIRHNGAPHLRSKPARTLSFFQYHSVDVISAYVAILVVLLYVIYRILRFAVCKIMSLFHKKSQHKKVD